MTEMFFDFLHLGAHLLFNFLCEFIPVLKTILSISSGMAMMKIIDNYK